MYPPELTAAMEAELTTVGFQALKTEQAVTEHFHNATGTTLLFINSLCGCAGGEARLGIIQALAASAHKPDHLITVFAGIDPAATAAAQTYMKPYPPSSPAIALFKAGDLVHAMERHQIKGVPAYTLAAVLQEYLQTYC